MEAVATSTWAALAASWQAVAAPLPRGKSNLSPHLQRLMAAFAAHDERRLRVDLQAGDAVDDVDARLLERA